MIIFRKMKEENIMKKNYKKVVAGTLGLIMSLGLFGCGEVRDYTDNGKSEEHTTNNFGNDVDLQTEAVADDGCVEECVEVAVDCAPTESAVGYYEEDEIIYPEEFDTNEYNDLAENSWMSVSVSPFSTFAADVDTASYAQIRSNIMGGYEVDPSMVRIEEMINYFHYDYETPKDGEKFAVHTEYTDCPWNEDTQLALVSLNTEAIDFSEAPDSNIVFLIDTSGSMYDANKLPLVQQSLAMLVENLDENDRVSIVTYAGSETIVLEGETGDNYYEIVSAIESLEASGSTHASAGIETAYELAEKYFIKGGNNRVILATDGDFNVGITGEGELEKYISQKKDSGVYLSVLGFGYGNYKDDKLETLADKGNGNYAYIDTIYEAKKALVDDMGATLVAVAKDVKLQVEFNPTLVKGYRLIGYENRVMAAEDFADDTKDGGEMGAGHSVTAIYEIVPVNSDMEVPEVESKYGTEEESIYESGEYSDELFTLNVRYKEIDEDESKLSSYVCHVDDYSEAGSDNLRWAAAVAAFGMILKDSEYKGDANGELVYMLADSVDDVNEDDYKKEFILLLETYFDYCNEYDDNDYYE